MTLSATDVCDEVIRRLNEIGFVFPEEDGHQEILDALARVAFVPMAPNGSRKGDVLFQADAFDYDDGLLIVEADGDGGALMFAAEGNYPVEYRTGYERSFDTEAEALRMALAYNEGEIDWDDLWNLDVTIEDADGEDDDEY